MGALTLDDIDSVSEADRDTLGPLPPPAWNSNYPYGPGIPQTMPYVTAPYNLPNDTASFASFGPPPPPPPPGVTPLGGNGSAGSVNSGSGSSASGGSERRKSDKEKSDRKSEKSGSDTASETGSVVSSRRAPPSDRSQTNLAMLPPDVGGSRQSFRMAMGNPYAEYL